MANIFEASISGLIAADEHLHGLVAHLLAYLVDVALGHQVSAGDQHDAVGDAVHLIENVAGDDQVHSLPAQLFKQCHAIRRGPWDPGR